jgi:ATP-dependent Clp protease ATP-binding subunit ClpA
LEYIFSVWENEKKYFQFLIYRYWVFYSSKNDNYFPVIYIFFEDIAKVIAHTTGIPVEKLLLGEKEKLLTMDKELGKRVVGKSTVAGKYL